MKRIICIVFLFYLFLNTRIPVSAHLAGQPSFFKMNGKYTALYPVQTTSIATFAMPQDSSPDKYLVDTPIELEIDTSKLQIPLEIINKTTFTWDFGDKSDGEGLKNSHAYKKMGSYVLSIYALSPDLPEKQLIQSVMIHVLPNAAYKLPESHIKINGKQTKDPLTDILEANFSQEISYDGTNSKAPSAKIASYYWDLGDESSSSKDYVIHTVPAKYYMVFPVLRIKDTNGFISDSFVQVNNNKKVVNSTKPTTSSENSVPPLLLFIAIGGGLFLIIFLFILSNNKKK